MLGFIVGLLFGGFVGIAATCINVAANDRTESACAEAYHAGLNERCDKANCPAWERWVERGE